MFHKEQEKRAQQLLLLWRGFSRPVKIPLEEAFLLWTRNKKYISIRTRSQSIYACPAYVNESYRSNPVCPPGFGTTIQF